MSGPGFGLPPYPDDGEPEDQTLRRRRREAANPELEITPPPERFGRWTARRDGRTVATAGDLQDLLNALDDIYGDRP